MKRLLTWSVASTLLVVVQEATDPRWTGGQPIAQIAAAILACEQGQH